MAATVTVAFSEVPGATKIVFGTIAGDSSYPTGGYPIAASSLASGAQSIVALTPAPPRGVAGTVASATQWDATNQKLLVFNTTAGAQTANATNLSAMVIDYVALVR